MKNKTLQKMSPSRGKSEIAHCSG